MEAHEQQLNQQIKNLVARLEAHQQAVGQSNKEFASSYKEWLTSETSWTRLRNGNWDEKLNAQRWLKKLSALVQRVESGQSFNLDSFIQNLPFPTEFARHLKTLKDSQGDRRAMVVLAPEGVGKSWTAIHLCNRRNGETTPYFYLRLRATWREKPLSIMQAMALLIGAPVERTPAGQQEQLINYMRTQGQKVLFLDEAHNGGVVLFKVLKDLIDETSWRFVYLAFPTQYDEVRSKNTGAIAEARQFLRRCVRPIFDDYRSGIGADDVEAYLKASGFKGPVKEFAARQAPLLRAHYNLATLVDAIELAEGRTDEKAGRRATLEDVELAINTLTSTAAERRYVKAQSGKEAAGRAPELFTA